MDIKRLIHKITGNVGVFEKIYKPTGKPVTIQIRLDDGRIYFAPANEFVKLTPSTSSQ